MISPKVLIKTIDYIDNQPDMSDDKFEILKTLIRELSDTPMGVDGHNIINWFNFRLPEIKKKYGELN